MRRYIIPKTEIYPLSTEHDLLVSSIMTIGGTTDHFDTRRQDPWSTEWEDEVES